MDDQNKVNRGSEWRKWDLHIHTPYSHTSQYFGDTEEKKWENFFDALENLPEEIKVIGVNDYLFLNGYKRVLKYKNDGNLKNIDLVLPVIEFRLTELVGHESLKKINYHVIFADESLLGVEVIEAQFLSGFRSACNLDPHNPNGVTFGGVVTKDSIIDFGKDIYESTPVASRSGDDFFEIGFNSLSYSLEKLRECLGEIKTPNTYLKNKYIKAIGKVEWEDFRWSGSVGEKKDLIDCANFVFSASPNSEQAINNIDTLKQEGVNSRLLHCSDAHTAKYSVNTDGKPKFEYDGTSPKDLGHCFTWIKGNSCFETLRQASVDYNSRVLIQDRDPADNKNSSASLFIDKIEYFLNETKKTLYFNKDINSTIGKRGAGKSVLLKHIAYECGAQDIKEINKLLGFRVYWCDGINENKFVEYIPQNYLSAITYEDGDKYDERDQKLRELLFNNELFKNADINITEVINSIELKIATNIKEILKFDKQILDTNIQLKPLGNVKDKENSIKLKQKEIDKFGKVDITDDDIVNQSKFVAKIEQLKKEIDLAKQDSKIIANINNTTTVDLIKIDDEIFSGLSQATYQLIKDHVNRSSTNDVKDFLSKTLNKLYEITSKSEKDRDDAEALLKPINDKLQKNKAIEQILKEINGLNTEKVEIIKLLSFIETSNQEKVKSINSVVTLYLSFKDKIESIVETLKDEFKDLTFITFDFQVGYKSDEYKNNFFDNYIDARSGDDFKKYEERDFTEEELQIALKNIISREAKIKPSVDIESTITSLLKCRYNIDFTKSVKYKVDEENYIDFENMTGGQKAMALLDLIFGLSKSNYPIIIDQPENDIDVSGISNDLKKLISKQRIRRQVIIATHSPNLLLLTDSENVIVAENKDNTIEYHNGGIEDKLIQKDIINILEGGKTALEKRMNKLSLTD